jgi:hypothetical protein
MSDIVNHLSPYHIHRANPTVSLRNSDTQTFNLLVSGKKSFFDRPLQICHYDFRTQKMVCQDLDQKYQVEATVEALGSSYPLVGACLGLLCARKLCLHFPYCYGGVENSWLARETMHTTLEKLLTEIKPGEAVNPYFLGSLLFQFLWGVKIASQVWQYRQHIGPKNIGVVRLLPSQKAQHNLLLYYAARGLKWRVPTFGFLVKIVPDQTSTIFSNQPMDLTLFAKELLSLLTRCDASTWKKAKACEVILRLLHDMAHTSSASYDSASYDRWLNALLPLFGTSESSPDIFWFQVPSSTGSQLLKAELERH